MTKFFPFLATIFLVASTVAPTVETRQVSLPATQIYFQCGNTTDPSHDYDAIDWDEPIESHYSSVLMEATNITYGEGIEVRWRRCSDLHSRQFRLSIEGVAEYADPIPTADDIALALSEHSDRLREALSAACFGERLFAYRARVGDRLGGTSWSTRLCRVERWGERGATNDDVDRDAGMDWDIPSSGHAPIVLILLYILMCCIFLHFNFDCFFCCDRCRE